MPATAALMGTPAAIRDMDEAHTLAWDVEPLEDTTSDTQRIAYGNSSTEGSTGTSERSASAPWPISLRPGEREAFASPTE